jgi:hypothetical protein
VGLPVAIIGSGNIGTDLTYKIEPSPSLALVALIGIDPASNGLARARDPGHPVMSRQQAVDRAGPLLGCAGVYGSFLLHAQRAAERHGFSPADILLQLGRRKVVGGQEDMIIDVAVELAHRHAEEEVTP